MPGTPSGENHSSESHACGRNRMPRLSSSMYRRRIWRLSAERSMESFRSQKRSDSSFSSGRRVHGSAWWRSFAWRRRLAEATPRRTAGVRDMNARSMVTRASALRRLVPRAYPSLAALSWVDKAAPGGTATLAPEPQHCVSEQTIGIALDERLLHQAVAPQSGDGTCSVVRSGELPANSGHHVRIASEICSTEDCVAKIAGAAEGMEGSAERRRGRSGPFPRSGRFGGLGGVRHDGCLRPAGERGMQRSSQGAARIQYRGRLASRAGRLAGMLLGRCAIGEEKHDGGGHARERLGIELPRIVRAGERLPAPLRHRKRPRGARRNPYALPPRGQMALLLPPLVTLDLIACIETVALEHTLCHTNG